jgi:hypothetical protein
MFKNLPKYKDLLTKAINRKQTPKKLKELLKVVQQLLHKKLKTLPSKVELEKLLTDLESLGDLSQYEEFLSRVWLFTGQAFECKNKKIVEHELERALGTTETENIYIHFFYHLINWFRESDTSLTKNFKLWRDIISYATTKINKQTLKLLDVPDINFCKDELNSMKEQLRSSDKLLKIVSNCIALSSLKVHQSLVDFTHMLVYTSNMQAHMREICALLGQECNILIVVGDGTVDMGSLIHLLEFPVKLILIAESVVVNDSKYTFNTLNDRIGFVQLNEKSRNKLLSVPVHFQGHDVLFKELISSDHNPHEILHPDVIVQLKDKLKLGDSLMGEIDYYEPLSLQRGDEVETILPHTTTDMPVIELEQQTTQKMETLEQDLDNETCVFRNVQSVMEVPHRLVLISAGPGTGKSTLITHVALHTKEAQPATWVISVDLNSFSQDLNELPTNLKISHVKDFLLKVSGITTAFEPLFRNKLESMENVCVLFDGFF